MWGLVATAICSHDTLELTLRQGSLGLEPEMLMRVYKIMPITVIAQQKDYGVDTGFMGILDSEGLGQATSAFRVPFGVGYATIGTV